MKSTKAQSFHDIGNLGIQLVETLDSNEIAEEMMTIKISFTTRMSLSLDPIV